MVSLPRSAVFLDVLGPIPEPRSPGLLGRLVESHRRPAFIRDTHASRVQVDEQAPTRAEAGEGAGSAVARLAQELMESEERVRALAVSGCRCVWMIVPGNETLELAGTNWWEEFSGQPRSESRGMGWLKCVHPGDHAATRAAWEAALLGDTEFAFEYRGRRRDGQWRILAVRGVPIRAAGGAVREWIGTLMDITEQHRAKAELDSARENLQLIADVIPVAVARCSRDLRYVWANRRYAELIGSGTPEEIAGRPMADVLGEEALEAIRPQIERTLSGAPAEYDTQVRTRAGEPRWLHVVHTPTRGPDGRVDGWVTTQVDITQRRASEEQLRQQTRLLASSVSDLEDFAHIAAHDLKEPMRGIRLTIGMLKEDARERLIVEDVARLDKLDALSGRMNELLDATLRYSQIGRASIELVRADLGALAAETTESLRPLLSGAGARVEIMRGMPVVECDPALVRQILANLIANAVKYNTAQNKRVRIGADQSKAVPVFCVEDNGVGIPLGLQDCIFLMFKRLHHRDGFIGGTGAGLAIVKRAVERHGGRVWVESEPGRGSTFYFTLAPDQTADGE